MGEIQKEKRLVKLIFGMLATNVELFEKIERRIAYDYGDIERSSEIIPFTYTNYYVEEMGESIFRKWISCKDLIYEYELVEVKQHTNNLEKLFMPQSANGRIVNIDPGIITLDKLILATTKNFTHRILMSEGIFAEVTLNFKKHEGFFPNPWTYPDYKDPKNIEFFNLIRNDLKQQYVSQGIKH